MQENNVDIKGIIGFILIGVLLMLWVWTNPPEQAEIIEQENQQTEIEVKSKDKENINENFSIEDINNDLFDDIYKDNSDYVTEIKNNLFDIKFSKKGGQISHLALNKFIDYNGSPIFLIRDGNSIFNIDFKTFNNRVISTKNQNFISHTYKDGNNDIVSMKLTVSDEKYLEYLYVIKPDEYVIDISMKSRGFADVVNHNEDYVFSWELNGIRNSKSISYENRYTRLTYYHDDNKIDKLSQMGDDEDEVTDINWISFRQHFFSSILIPSNKTFKAAKISSRDLVKDEAIDTLYTKHYTTQIPFSFNNNEFNESFRIYFGPTDGKVFNKHDLDLDESIPFGWGIFGFINKSVFVPLFRWLSSIFPYGIAIIFMTILVRLALAPVLYKSYLSQAKMKILKPDVEQLNKQFKDNAMKRQQEMMSLYSKAGASPMSGCLPALLQIPVFYALFMFFPSAFDLRQKSFLWAEDLSAYDSIMELPFRIWGYGDHVSLFPILAAISIFFICK